MLFGVSAAPLVTGFQFGAPASGTTASSPLIFGSAAASAPPLLGFGAASSPDASRVVITHQLKTAHSTPIHSILIGIHSILIGIHSILTQFTQFYMIFN